MADITEQVLNHHLYSFNTGDIDAILSDYTDESKMIIAGGPVLTGPTELKPMFEQTFKEFAQPGAKLNLISTTIHGDIAVITWSAETPDNTYDFATDTFLIRDGKIVSQVFALKVTPRK